MKLMFKGLLAIPTLILAVGCSDNGDGGAATDAGVASMKTGAKGSIKLTIDGRMHQFGYLANCTISPGTVGVMAYEQKPDSKSEAWLGSFRIVGSSVGEELAGRIEINYSDEGFAYEGPIAIDGKTLTWSGAFKQFQKTYAPGEPATPSKEIGTVDGSGSVSC